MWDACLKYFPSLALAIFLNILLGLYNNIAIKKIGFDVKVFIKGVIKALIFTICIFGVALIFDSVDILGDTLSPDTILISGIIFYVAKVVKALKEFLVPQEGDPNSLLGDLDPSLVDQASDNEDSQSGEDNKGE